MAVIRKERLWNFDWKWIHEVYFQVRSELNMLIKSVQIREEKKTNVGQKKRRNKWRGAIEGEEVVTHFLRWQGRGKMMTLN